MPRALFGSAIGTAALLATAALGLPATGAAQEGGADAPRAMLILDGSGSMWGRLDGRPKIEIAREAIGRMLNDWDPEVHLGLMAYGHREEGDCTDIEVIIEPGPLDRATYDQALAGITPKGKTPLTAATRQAAEALGHRDAPATVILVSDGKETCDADPCSAARTLAETGTDFTAHVIGFDVDEEAQQELACLAEATGGAFFAPHDADGLADALTRVTEVKSAKPAETPLSEAQVDEFERAELGEAWEVANPMPSAFILDQGTLTAMTANPGDMGSDEAANVFRWIAAELPDGDFAITAEFTARLGEVKVLGGRRAVIQVGRWQDAENYIAAEIARQGNSNDDMWLRLRAVQGGNATVEEVEIAGDVRGYDLAQILSDFEGQGARLSVVKRGRDYIARLETLGWTLQPDGPAVIETEPLMVLRGAGAPALFAGTRGPEQTLVMFDRVRISAAD